jgi:hypothetical protein
VIPDWAECVNLVSIGASPIAAILTNTQKLVGTGIGYITIENPGGNYPAGGAGITINISDPTGSGFGAPSNVFVYNNVSSRGNIIGIRLNNGSRGSNYTAPVVSISSPSGSGAAATATVGIPWTQNRKISLVNISSTIAQLSGNFLNPKSNVNYALQPLQSISIIYQSNAGYICDAYTPLTAASLNGGQLAGMRNRIINGGMAIDQRNNGASQFISGFAYTVDRWFVLPTGGDVIGVRVAGSGSAQYRYQMETGIGAQEIIFAQFIEAANCYDLAGETITLSVDLASNSIASVGWVLYYPPSTDSWSSYIVAGTGFFAINETISRYSAQVSLPAAANTGLQVQFFVGNVQSGAYWTIGELVPIDRTDWRLV